MLKMPKLTLYVYISVVSPSPAILSEPWKPSSIPLSSKHTSLPDVPLIQLLLLHGNKCWRHLCQTCNGNLATPPPLLSLLWCTDICGSKKLGDQKKDGIEFRQKWLRKVKHTKTYFVSDWMSPILLRSSKKVYLIVPRRCIKTKDLNNIKLNATPMDLKNKKEFIFGPTCSFHLYVLFVSYTCSFKVCWSFL